MAMGMPSYPDAFEVLCLQAADGGRGPVLFGESLERARKTVRPFIVGREFPNVYLEFPLAGDPFLDVTVLYGQLDPDTHIDSAAAGDVAGLFSWYAGARASAPEISCGFELDTKLPELATAAVHFQPRKQTELVRPFCEAVGEPERADLYLDLAARMPEGWPLSFFGMFRGRPGSPLRVCGYLREQQRFSYAEDSRLLAEAFDQVGFSAYDDAMLAQVAALMETAPIGVDFQFDVHPDGGIGSTFAIDIQLAIQRPEQVRESFANGPASRVMGLLEEWGAADARWKLVADAAFARAVPVIKPDGTLDRFSFTLMPQWVKARWIDCVLQPAKLYDLGGAGIYSGSVKEGAAPEAVTSPAAES